MAKDESVPPGRVDLDEHTQALNDLELVLCQRGTSYFQVSTFVLSLCILFLCTSLLVLYIPNLVPKPFTRSEMVKLREKGMGDEAKHVRSYHGSLYLTTALQGDSCAVKLFSITQDSVLDNLLDFNSRVQSQKLTSIVQYLRIATTPVTMPRAHTLTKLWELITDPIVSIVCCYS